MAKRILKGTFVQLLDHEDVPYHAINAYAEVDYCRDGGIGVIVRDKNGRVMPLGSARFNGVLRLPVEAIRTLSPLESLAVASINNAQ